MNQEKAIELFSAYYEGELEPALQFALEQRLKADPNLQADYESFIGTYASLSAMRDEPIEIPMYLSDRIATRLDELEQSRKQSIFDLRFFGRFWVGGVAALAIVATVATIHTYSKVSTAGLGAEDESAVPAFAANGANVTLQFDAPGTHTITVQTGSDKRPFTVNHPDKLSTPLENPTPSSKLFTVQVEGSNDREVVVVPGVSARKIKSGEGTLGDFAVAFSDYYHTPILLENVNMSSHIKWTLQGSDSLKAATTALAPLSLTVGARNDGMISILTH